jgi:hypothetical protein
VNVDSNDVAVEDVRAIAVALGLGGHARPYSAHEVVVREILPALATTAAEVTPTMTSEATTAATSEETP